MKVKRWVSALDCGWGCRAVAGPGWRRTGSLWTKEALETLAATSRDPVEVGASSEALAAASTGAEELDAADPGAEELEAADPGAEELEAAGPSVEKLEVADPAGPAVERGGGG